MFSRIRLKKPRRSSLRSSSWGAATGRSPSTRKRSYQSRAMGCGRIGGVIEVRRVPATDPAANAMLQTTVANLQSIYGSVEDAAPVTAEDMTPEAGGGYVLLGD